MRKPQKYVKKPVEILAIRWIITEHYDNTPNVLAFLGLSEDDVGETHTMGNVVKRHIKVETLEGIMQANIGDWLIEGLEGEHYPCKDSVFRKTYDITDNEYGLKPNLEGGDADEIEVGTTMENPHLDPEYRKQLEAAEAEGMIAKDEN